MKVLLPLLATIWLFSGAAFCGSLADEWKDWKLTHGKHYAGKEEGRRFDIWEANHKIVKEHNALYASGETTYQMGMNEYAAMTAEEFRAMLIPSTKAGLSINLPSNQTAIFTKISSLPESVDWRQYGYVTSVKNQGQLGTCYSFSAVEAIEGQYSKQTGTSISLSEQQVVDCNQGGDGGIPYKVYKYLMSCGGSQTEAQYPYVDKVGNCKFDKGKVAATLSSYKFVRPFGSELALKIAVAKAGPVSVSAIKIFESFQLYKSGIYYEAKCNIPELDGQGYHAMLATGYGTQEGKDYWMVKNSWGTGWGENGYIQMSRNKDNNCGIASQATYPIMASKQPKNYASAETTTTGSGNKQLFSLWIMLLALFITVHLQNN